MSKIHLLVIDPQNDFMDQDGAALPVAGATADMRRLASFIEVATGAIEDVTITLDSHHSVGIERPALWRTAGGQQVAAFTQITAAQVRAGEFTLLGVPEQKVLAYLDALEAAGRYKLMVWPAHCEIGTWGHNIAPVLRDGCAAWEAASQRPALKVFKGMNPWTEAYSALAAEVPDPSDPSSQLNVRLIARLNAAERIVVAGEASSHCVRATVEHLADELPADRLAKIVLLTDCMSPVAGFEQQAQAFQQGMAARGVRLATSREMAQELL